MIQLGTRWSFGTTPPGRLSPDVVAAIHDVERAATVTGRQDFVDATWTLTWLESRPIAQLDREGDDGEPLTVRVDPAGRTVRSDVPAGDDEVW